MYDALLINIISSLYNVLALGMDYSETLFDCKYLMHYVQSIIHH